MRKPNTRFAPILSLHQRSRGLHSAVMATIGAIGFLVSAVLPAESYHVSYVRFVLSHLTNHTLSLATVVSSSQHLEPSHGQYSILPLITHNLKTNQAFLLSLDGCRVTCTLPEPSALLSPSTYRSEPPARLQACGSIKRTRQPGDGRGVGRREG